MTSLTQARKQGARPRYITPRNPNRPTLGPAVTTLSAHLGKPFLPWQAEVADVALEIDPATGLLAYSELDLIVMRQNGKSEFMLPYMAHRCMGWTQTLVNWVRAELGMWVPLPGPQRVIYMAQTADDARLNWRTKHLPRLQQAEATRGLFTATLQQNKEMLHWANGSTWSPTSTTAKTAGTGDSVDLALIDEAWSRPDNATELGVRPAMLTRPWRQLVLASMIPGPTRTKGKPWSYLATKQAAGRARVDSGVVSSTCYVEFGAQPGLDPGDPATWWSAMPALGWTITERAVQEDWDAMREAGKQPDFEAEYLSWEPTNRTKRWLIIPDQVWNDRHDPNSSALDPVALGVAVSPDRRWCSIASAGMSGRDNLHVELVERREGVDWALHALMHIVEHEDVCAIGVNPAGQESSLLDRLTVELEKIGRADLICKPTIRESCAASARFFDATGLGSSVATEFDDGVDTSGVLLRHLGQEELNRAVAMAVRLQRAKPLWEWDFTGPVDPLRAATVAWWAGIRRDWNGGAYDIGSTLG